MASRSRPAQGNNSTPRRIRYSGGTAGTAPTVVSSGSVSKPRDTRWGNLKRQPADATPKVVQS